MLFLPTGNPPHKHDGLADKYDRLRMVELAIENEQGMSVSREEIDRGGVIFDLLVQIGIELQQFLKRSIGLRLFFSRRRLSESEFRRRNGNAECGGATHKCTARKIHVFIHKPGPHRLVEII